MPAQLRPAGFDCGARPGVGPGSDPAPTPLRPRSDPAPTPVRPRSDPGPTPIRPRSDPGPTPVRPGSDPGLAPGASQFLNRHASKVAGPTHACSSRPKSIRSARRARPRHTHDGPPPALDAPGM